jgi:hypothetical protein
MGLQKYRYRFTALLPKMVCRRCGATFTKDWSSGGVGAVCENCFDARSEMDLVERGLIRNIKKYRNVLGDITFDFQANIDGRWYNCINPCGNWAMVEAWETCGIFSVPVGWWELKELWEKHTN